MGADSHFVSTIEYAKKENLKQSFDHSDSGRKRLRKEVFAQAIHNFSKRVDEPFVAINNGAIPNQLIESELFGYEEGAYTGAKRRQHRKIWAGQ